MLLSTLRLSMEIRAMPPNDDDLMKQAIGGVLDNGENGELPLFACTLGLPRHILAESVERPFELVPEPHYTLAASSAPPLFFPLLELLLSNRSPGLQALEVGALARAIATAAALGERHLWEDLGLSGRDAVSRLLERYFEPLYRRNTSDMRWKRFLYAELGTLHEKLAHRLPGCGKCEQYPHCLAPEKTH